MKNSTKTFKDYLGDIEELKFKFDQNGDIVSIKGKAVLNDLIFKITVNRRSADITPDAEPLTVKPLYRGTISMLSPENGSVLLSETLRRKYEAEGKTYKNKDIYASVPFRCNSIDREEIAFTLRKQIDKLILRDGEQHAELLFKWITPDQLTPALASAKYVDTFLNVAYPSSPPERNDLRKRSIQKVFSKLPDRPMCKIKARDVNAIISTEHITDENVRLCHLFWEYLLSSRRCSGSNPLPLESNREPSAEAKDRKAFTPTEFGWDVFTKMFSIISQNLNSICCAIVLLISGFSVDDILALTWDDIEFVDGFDDFAIIHIRKEYKAAAKHDFSRPTTPDAALYLRRVYDYLCKTYSTENVGSWHVAADAASPERQLEKNALNVAANDLLIRAGYKGRLITAGRPGSNSSSPTSLLTSNYRHKLISTCGLQNDPDTFNFLSGLPFNSSTYTNYESHTSPEAQYRLYTILKPLSVERKLKPPAAPRTAENRTIFTAVPDNNHSVAQLVGSIQLNPGETIKISVPHGVTGRIHTFS